MVSLVLQAVGGALAAPGSHVMVAGLAFQALTMLCFVLAAADFAVRARGPLRRATSLRFRLFLGAASLLILWRSCFRVAELSEGWSGPVMADQGMFIGFEGVLVAVAVVALVVFHPAVCARELFEGGGERGLRWEAEAEAEGTGTGLPSVEEKDV